MKRWLFIFLLFPFCACNSDYSSDPHSFQVADSLYTSWFNKPFSNLDADAEKILANVISRKMDTIVVARYGKTDTTDVGSVYIFWKTDKMHFYRFTPFNGNGEEHQLKMSWNNVLKVFSDSSYIDTSASENENDSHDLHQFLEVSVYTGSKSKLYSGDAYSMKSKNAFVWSFNSMIEILEDHIYAGNY